MTTDTTPGSALAGWGREPVCEPARRGDDLAACTKVPPERIGEFLDWPDAKLHRETRRLRRVLVRFAKAVLASMESSSAVDDFVRSLDLVSISRDHDWRQIFSAIRESRRPDEDYRQRVLVRYLQYLSFRRRLLAFIQARRQGLEETGTFSGWQCPPSTASGALADEARAGERASSRRHRIYARLPLGEPVELALGERRRHKLVLAGHALYLHGTCPPSLRDARGATFRLERGRNLVGRHPESDIVLDAGLGGISRVHLVLTWEGGDRVQVTDLSSAGTLLRRAGERGSRREPEATGAGSA